MKEMNLKQRLQWFSDHASQGVRKGIRTIYGPDYSSTKEGKKFLEKMKLNDFILFIKEASEKCEKACPKKQRETMQVEIWKRYEAIKEIIKKEIDRIDKEGLGRG